MIYSRTVLKLIQKTQKSILLLGPRQTGKSTLIQSLKPDFTFNLAEEREFLRFSKDPDEILNRLEGIKNKTVFIDEVQRIPSLLNTIQTLLDNKKRGLRFFLTGSSARKLKRGQANLLPGRLIALYLNTLTAREMEYSANTSQLLRFGSLPGIISEKSEFDQRQLLLTYSGTYLREEIQAESLARNMEGFSRFLSVIASRTTDFLDLAKFSNQASINRESARRYFEVLEDTLIIETLEAFSQSNRRRLVQHPKFFLFDNGVLNGLLENFELSSDRKGMLFENLIYTQIKHSARALGIPLKIFSYRTEHSAEVDLIVELRGSIWAIEVKSTDSVRKPDLRGFKSFQEYYGKKHERIIVHPGKISSSIEGVHILPWQVLLKEMGL